MWRRWVAAASVPAALLFCSCSSGSPDPETAPHLSLKEASARYEANLRYLTRVGVDREGMWARQGQVVIALAKDSVPNSSGIVRRVLRAGNLVFKRVRWQSTPF